MGSKRELNQLYLLAEHYINTGDPKEQSNRYYLASHILERRFTPIYKQFETQSASVEKTRALRLAFLLELPFIIPIVGSTNEKYAERIELPTMQNPAMQIGIFGEDRRVIRGEQSVIGLREELSLLSIDEAYMNFSSHIEGIEAMTLAKISLPMSMDTKVMLPSRGVVKHSDILGGPFLLTNWEAHTQRTSLANGIFPRIALRAGQSTFTLDDIDCLYEHYRSLHRWVENSAFSQPRDTLPAPIKALKNNPALFPVNTFAPLGASSVAIYTAKKYAPALPRTLGLSMKIDYKRIFPLLKLADSLQDSPNSPLWSKFLRSVSLVSGWYVDKLSKIPLLCEHNRFEKPEVKFGVMSDSMNIVCKICGERLLGERFVVDDALATRQLDTLFGEIIYNDVSTLLHTRAVRSLLEVDELALVLYTALHPFLKSENKELQKVNIQKRKVYRHFVAFIAVTSTIIAMTKVLPSKVISFSKKEFRNALKKNYIEFIQELSFSLHQIEEQAERYWTDSISKSFEDPSAALNEMILHTGDESVEEALQRGLRRLFKRYSSTDPFEEKKPTFDVKAPPLDKIWAAAFLEYLKNGDRSRLQRILAQYRSPVKYHTELFKLFSKYNTQSSKITTQPKMLVDIKERRTAFANEVRVVCPARKEQFLPHEFDKGKCKYCGIPSFELGGEPEITDAYFKKYEKFIFDVWSVTKVLKEQSTVVKITSKPISTVDKAINNKALYRFESVFGALRLANSESFRLDLAAIVNAIGKPALAAGLLASPSKYMATAVNTFIGWALENSDKKAMVRELILFFNGD